MSEIEKMFNRVGLLGVAVQMPYTGEIIGWKPMEFTTEKQLEIVKFLLNKSVYYDTYGDREYWFRLSDKIENSKYREFDEAIAECINNMWEDLRDYEKQQIKEILK